MIVPLLTWSVAVQHAQLPNVVSAPSFASLPFTVEERASRGSSLVLLLLLLPMLGLVTVPVTLMLVLASHEVIAAVAHHPVAGVLVGGGLAILVALFLVPATRIIQRLGSRRCVTFATDRVLVTERSLFRSRHWSVPLADYRGIVHHIRATLSGVRHEIILVHPARERSVLLHAAHAVAQSTIDRACALLRLPQIPAGELYRLTPRRRRNIGIVPEAQPA